MNSRYDRAGRQSIRLMVLIVTLFVWVVILPPAVIVTAWTVSVVGARRRRRAERTHERLVPPLSGQVLHFPTAERHVGPTAAAR